jgi:Immunity protein 26
LRRVKKKEGDIFRVELDESRHSYAVALKHPLFAFLDIMTDSELSVNSIENLKVIFAVCVMDYATKSGIWDKVGHTEVFKDYLDDYRFFKQDSISGRLTSYRDRDGDEFPIDYKTASTMEAAAVWDPHHIEERIRDHFAGKPNKWVEALRPRPSAQS